MDEQFEIENNVLVKYHKKDGVTDVVIPEGIIEIGESAFSDCDNLKSVIIPKSVTTIELLAFCGCTSLTSITIPEGVTTIGEGAFMICTSLDSITLPESVEEIRDYAFSDCETCNNSIKTFNIPSYDIFNMLDYYSKLVVLNTIIRDKKQEQYSKEDISKFKQYIIKTKNSIFLSILRHRNLIDLFDYMLNNNIYTKEELEKFINDATNIDGVNPEITGILLEYINKKRKIKTIQKNIDDRYLI